MSDEGPRDTDIVWRWERPDALIQRAAVGIASGVVGVGLVVTGILLADFAIGALGVFLLVVAGANAATRRGKVGLRDIVVTDQSIILRYKSGKSRALPRTEVSRILWDGELGTEIVRRSRTRANMSLPLRQAEARELSIVLGVPFSG